jgi:hypothetical protein
MKEGHVYQIVNELLHQTMVVDGAKPSQALLQIVGWRWVTKWRERPEEKALRTNIAELAERWKVAERTAYYRLQVLVEKDYLNVHYGTGRRISLTLGPRAIHSTPGEPPTQAVKDGDTTGHERWQHDRPREAATQQATGGGNTTGRERRKPASLEIALGVAAFFLAARLQAQGSGIGVLAIVTVTFAAISAIANLSYFLAHVDVFTTRGLVQAIALGIAAPLVALANAVLSGELAGIAQVQREQAADAERLATAQEHERQMAALALERVRQLAAQERAKDRQVRRAVELVHARSGQALPATSASPASATGRAAAGFRRSGTTTGVVKDKPRATFWSCHTNSTDGGGNHVAQEPV